MPFANFPSCLAIWAPLRNHRLEPEEATRILTLHAAECRCSCRYCVGITWLVTEYGDHAGEHHNIDEFTRRLVDPTASFDTT